MEEKKYTIKDAADMMHVPTSTIRYYDKEGLLPFVERLESGYRIFTEKDLATLRIIDCLKKTGMSIREIRQFSQWLEQGDASLPAAVRNVSGEKAGGGGSDEGTAGHSECHQHEMPVLRGSHCRWNGKNSF